MADKIARQLLQCRNSRASDELVEYKRSLPAVVQYINTLIKSLPQTGTSTQPRSNGRTFRGNISSMQRTRLLCTEPRKSSITRLPMNQPVRLCKSRRDEKCCEVRYISEGKQQERRRATRVMHHAASHSRPDRAVDINPCLGREGWFSVSRTSCRLRPLPSGIVCTGRVSMSIFALIKFKSSVFKRN